MKALRKSGLHIPTILLSGHAAGEEHTGLQEAAVQAWLDKPPISWRLAEEIAKALGRE